MLESDKPNDENSSIKRARKNGSACCFKLSSHRKPHYRVEVRGERMKSRDSNYSEAGRLCYCWERKPFEKGVKRPDIFIRIPLALGIKKSIEEQRSQWDFWRTYFANEMTVFSHFILIKQGLWIYIAQFKKNYDNAKLVVQATTEQFHAPSLL